MFVVDNRTWPLHSCGTKSGRFHSQEAPPLYFHHDKQNPKSFTDGKKIADDFRFGLVRRVCAFAEKCREILRCSFPGAADVGGALVSEESVVEIAVCPFSLHKPIKTARRSFEAKKKKLSLFFFFFMPSLFPPPHGFYHSALYYKQLFSCVLLLCSLALLEPMSLCMHPPGGNTELRTTPTVQSGESERRTERGRDEVHTDD